jgi:hypothetical protein
VKALDVFFKKYQRIEDANLSELSTIVNKKTPIKLTVIHNINMAEQINRTIIDQME